MATPAASPASSSSLEWLLESPVLLDGLLDIAGVARLAPTSRRLREAVRLEVDRAREFCLSRPCNLAIMRGGEYLATSSGDERTAECARMTRGSRCSTCESYLAEVLKLGASLRRRFGEHSARAEVERYVLKAGAATLKICLNHVKVRGDYVRVSFDYHERTETDFSIERLMDGDDSMKGFRLRGTCEESEEAGGKDLLSLEDLLMDDFEGSRDVDYVCARFLRAVANRALDAGSGITMTLRDGDFQTSLAGASMVVA